MSTKKFILAQNKEEYGGAYFGKTSSGSPDYFIFPSNISTNWDCTIAYGTNSGSIVGWYHSIADRTPVENRAPGSTSQAEKFEQIKIWTKLPVDTAEWAYSANYTSQNPFIGDYTFDNKTITLNATKTKKTYKVTVKNNTKTVSYGSVASIEGERVKLADTYAGHTYYFDVNSVNSNRFYTTPIDLSWRQTITGNTTLTPEQAEVSYGMKYGGYTFVLNSAGTGIINQNHTAKSEAHTYLNWNTPNSIQSSDINDSPNVLYYFLIHYKQECEWGHDYLHFYKQDDDYTEICTGQGKKAGIVAYKCLAGQHAAKVTFTKDGSVDAYTDTATLTKIDIARIIIDSYFSGYSVGLEVTNDSDYPITVTFDENNSAFESSSSYYNTANELLGLLESPKVETIPPHSFKECGILGDGCEIINYALAYNITSSEIDGLNEKVYA